MSVQVSFRVVGVYCYFENLVLPNNQPSDTVKSIMDAVAAAQPAFSYGAGDEVTTMSYTFSNDSTQPYNTSGRPPNGFRSLSEAIGPTSLVWQYYRSVTGSINGTVCEIKIISKTSQPKFGVTPLNSDLVIPAGFNISTYNLTWRLVQIEMSPQAQAARHANAQKAASRLITA